MKEMVSAWGEIHIQIWNFYFRSRLFAAGV